jgi:hypothetical protein
MNLLADDHGGFAGEDKKESVKSPLSLWPLSFSFIRDQPFT